MRWKNRPYVVVVDPGHGGKEPGAVNKEKDIMEKDIVLSISEYMSNYVRNEDYLFGPLRTRINDQFISLQHRCDIANDIKADAFLSIHINARHQRGKRGLEIETYHYPGSEKGQEFAHLLQSFLMNTDYNYPIPLINRGVKEKGFYVLKHTTMPACLVELGFIRDPEEAEFLIRPMNQIHLAITLAEATEMYLEGGSHEWKA